VVHDVSVEADEVAGFDRDGRRTVDKVRVVVVVHHEERNEFVVADGFAQALLGRGRLVVDADVGRGCQRLRRHDELVVGVEERREGAQAELTPKRRNERTRDTHGRFGLAAGGDCLLVSLFDVGCVRAQGQLAGSERN